MKLHAKQFFIDSLKWVVSGIIAILITSLVVLGYNYSGVHVENSSGSTDYKWMPNQYKANATEGINYMHMDANGFNNLVPETEAIGLLLMGGSHMEAIQIKTELNTGSLLNKIMPELYTYNIGMSGHQFLNCLDNLDDALDEFNPTKYVVIQTGDIVFSKDDIIAVKNHTLGNIPSYDSGFVFFLQKIPAIKVLFKQLSDKLSNDRKRAISSPSDSSDSNYSYVSLILNDVLSEKKNSCEKQNCSLIVAYTPPISITTSGTMERNDELEWVNQVKKCCDDNGIVFLDCFDFFEYEYTKNYIVPYGFDNSKIAAGHLNENGHRILASVIAQYIEGELK